MKGCPRYGQWAPLRWPDEARSHYRTYHYRRPGRQDAGTTPGEYATRA
ncbi:hypothetical protein [Arsenicicoccus dermatophilus]|nr:hypothetical protein [Arsenicicoccus dermatophilus]MCH8613435.1 hypothetical protein [Arsenicicoccus dermatophilus]